jgi:hypothetical protein
MKDPMEPDFLIYSIEIKLFSLHEILLRFKEQNCVMCLTPDLGVFPEFPHSVCSVQVGTSEKG